MVRQCSTYSIEIHADTTQALSSRFIACLLIVRDQQNCFMDYSLTMDPLSELIALDWLRQIAIEASQAFQEIYEEIKLFVAAPRPKKKFIPRKREVAQVLGLISQAILNCLDGASRQDYPVC